LAKTIADYRYFAGGGAGADGRGRLAERAGLGILLVAVYRRGLFGWQQKLIFNRERDACFKAFMNNNYVGLVLFLGLAMSYLQ
jgi:4-hydroxybenzoate polyprenyltransferase